MTRSKRPALGFESADSLGDYRGGSLRVPGFAAGRHEHPAGSAHRGRVAQLLLSFLGPNCEGNNVTTVLLDELHSPFQSTLLVRAGGEPKMGGVDRHAIRGDVDLGAW